GNNDPNTVFSRDGKPLTMSKDANGNVQFKDPNGNIIKPKGSNTGLDLNDAKKTESKAKKNADEEDDDEETSITIGDDNKGNVCTAENTNCSTTTVNYN